MWTQRDQFSNSQIPLCDQDLIVRQHHQRATNHPYSEKSKAPLAKPLPSTPVTVGDLVYLHADRNKTRARDRYLVVSVDGQFCNIRKFVGSQLRSTSYRVKMSECYKVAAEISHSSHPRIPRDNDSSDDEIVPSSQPTTPPSQPVIPTAISTPATQPVPDTV